MTDLPTLIIRESSTGVWTCEKCPSNGGADVLMSYQASLEHAAKHICSGKFYVRHVPKGAK